MQSPLKAADRDPEPPATAAIRGPLVVHGAGGHGRVVAEAARLAGFDVLGFLDDGGSGDWAHAGDLPPGAAVHVAIGDGRARERCLERHLAAGRHPATVVHPRAAVSPSATLGRNVFVGPLAVVGVGTRLRDGVILNSGSILEHGSSAGTFAHLAPGAITGGGVSLGRRCLVGLGARVLPGMRIGAGATIGAGSIVLRGVADGETVAGVVR
ncbi:acetyltransferase [Phycisphaera mikurensis]|uniref:Putative acyltransferase n=1 Tax=Phycisphaera mikurensis (strain NBRC 102666 / KCTC 22515 / FYK2301M01) TaxID=1142394 RepID=I0IF70_PHYMF|nr:acetyltransferase [Phycisphaera mikurensis]MBB6440696.1 UDP-N-acetylbacillosamine N-acetyltransferase [Phycisphaera mikurensis]BAM03908.1 putative acyltransferase [Phycisphaera mikurensis NBRC 102666]